MAGKTEFTRTELCELLTEDEVSSLGAASTGRPTNSPMTGDEICQWSNETSVLIDFGRNASQRT